jgi:hypothetical protein
MSAARETEGRLEGRPRARGAAEARRGRPSARSEPDTSIPAWHRGRDEGDPQGPTPRDSVEAESVLFACKCPFGGRGMSAANSVAGPEADR